MKRERRIKSETISRFSGEVRDVLTAYIHSEPKPTVTNRFYQILLLNSRMATQMGKWQDESFESVKGRNLDDCCNVILH